MPPPMYPPTSGTPPTTPATTSALRKAHVGKSSFFTSPESGRRDSLSCRTSWGAAGMEDRGALRILREMRMFRRQEGCGSAEEHSRALTRLYECVMSDAVEAKE